MKRSDWVRHPRVVQIHAQRGVVVRALVLSTFFGLLLAPDRWGFPLVLISFAVVGAWAILYPQDILGWAKTAHRELDVEDQSLWWIPRLIGVCFLAIVLVIALSSLRR